MSFSILPESPRFLTTKDKSAQAAQILIKYHAEGDSNSLLVQAEIVQIRETIRAELEVNKESWISILKTPALRRRIYISIFVGLFTQFSGNTLLSYYSGVLFDMMGYTSDYAKTRINLAYACWAFVNGTLLALIVARFPRRLMYMTSASLMLCAFIGMTVSMQKMQVAQDAGVKNTSAGVAALFFYFAYNPTYNIGNNALTYSKWSSYRSVRPSLY
jgi:hypothetical protein